MFGEFLLKQKAITNDQLNEAINAQVIFGGRLGTNLIESGALTEDGLEKYLALYHRLPSVPMEQLNNIKTNILKLIPVNLVKRLKVIPFDYKDKHLYVIMMDPSRLDAIDELSFVTGLNIKLHVISEIHFLVLLEKYYSIKRDLRYITLSKQDTKQFLSDKLSKKTASTEQKSDEKIVEQPQEQARDNLQLTPLPNNEELTTEEDFQKMFKAESSGVESDKTTVELSDEMEIEETLRLKHPINLQDAITIISDSKSRDDIAAVVLGYALTIFKRAAIFIIQKGMAIGWEGAGEGVNRFNIKQLVIPLDQPSVFKFVNDTGAHFVGSLKPTELNKDFFLLLGGGQPKTVVIIPVHFMGKVVQMLYGDNGADEFASTNIGELLILLQKVPEVIEALVLKKRGKL